MDKMPQNIKKALLLSAGLFVVGKKKAEELAQNLKENGINSEEAEKVANEVLEAAKAQKNNFVQRLVSEVEKRNIFATKEDIEKLQKTVNEISNKLDESEE